MSITELTTFFGWMSAINIGLLMFSTVCIVLLKEKITPLHAKLFKLEDAYVNKAYFKFLAYYKLTLIVFNIVPYFALKLMA
jgi:hypothetical protein